MGLKKAFSAIVGKHHFDSLGDIMAVSVVPVFPGFLTLVLTHLSFKTLRLLFLTCITDERQKVAGKKVCSN